MNQYNLQQLTRNQFLEGNYRALSLVTSRSALSQLRHLQDWCQEYLLVKQDSLPPPQDFNGYRRRRGQGGIKVWRSWTSSFTSNGPKGIKNLWQRNLKSASPLQANLLSTATIRFAHLPPPCKPSHCVTCIWGDCWCAAWKCNTWWGLQVLSLPRQPSSTAKPPIAPPVFTLGSLDIAS